MSMEPKYHVTFRDHHSDDWQASNVLIKLEQLGTANKRFEWIHSDLSVSKSGFWSRLFFPLIKWFLDIDLEQSRSLLCQLGPQINTSTDDRLKSAYKSAITKFSEIAPHHIQGLRIPSPAAPISSVTSRIDAMSKRRLPPTVPFPYIPPERVSATLSAPPPTVPPPVFRAATSSDNIDLTDFSWQVGATRVFFRIGLVEEEDIGRQDGALVNTANQAMVGGSGVNGSIRRKAGTLFLRECDDIRFQACCRWLRNSNRGATRTEIEDAAKKWLHAHTGTDDAPFVPTGTSVITSGGNLFAKNVVHVVGPRWDSTTPERCDALLYNSYKSALTTAMQNGVKKIAIPPISIGAFNYPLDRSAEIAAKAIHDFLIDHPDAFNEVRMMFFKGAADVPLIYGPTFDKIMRGEQ